MSYVYIQLYPSQIADRILAYQYNGFSYEAAQALGEYLCQYAEDIGTPIEFNIVELCSKWTEYDNLEEYLQYYPDEEFEELDELRERTTVIEIPGTDRIIVQDF